MKTPKCAVLSVFMLLAAAAAARVEAGKLLGDRLYAAYSGSPAFKADMAALRGFLKKSPVRAAEGEKISP
jgi:hypothetical protein